MKYIMKMTVIVVFQFLCINVNAENQKSPGLKKNELLPTVAENAKELRLRKIEDRHRKKSKRKGENSLALQGMPSENQVASESAKNKQRLPAASLPGR